jgi:hypothetical protein
MGQFEKEVMNMRRRDASAPQADSRAIHEIALSALSNRFKIFSLPKIAIK